MKEAGGDRDRDEKIDPEKMSKEEYFKMLRVKSRKNLYLNLKNNFYY